MDPFSLDFAALRTLRRVHVLGSFSRAAESLGVGQPSVSYTIGRMRKVFGDPLFVRQGGGIVATERCNEIVEEMGPMLDSFEALSAPRAFEPAAAEMTIAISCNYYERVTLLPRLLRVLRQEAPGMRLTIIPSQVRGREQLMRGESDLLIGPIRIEEAGYYRRTLMHEDYVCIMDPANPMAKPGLMTLETYVAAPQVVVNYGGSFRSAFLVELDRMGQRLNTVIEVPSPANLPDLLHGTDMIATVPRRIAHVFGARLAEAELPLKASLSIDLQWSARTHASAPHVWLRGQIAEAAAQLLEHEVAPRPS